MKVAELTMLDSNEKIIDYCLQMELNLQEKMKVIIETKKEKRLAEIEKIIDIEEKDIPDITSKIVKIATKKDLEQYVHNMKEAKEALKYAKKISKELELDMHFVDSYYTYDKKQLYLSYVADARVDFRELARLLAQKYKTRIELRQIGVRDKAKKVGGLGPCGLFLCCNTFLTDFSSVSINMAKNQFLALNPSKINGLCGRLLCCLNYEDENYIELKKGMPSIGTLAETNEGIGKVVSLDIFKRTYKIEVKNKGQIEMKVETNEDTEAKT